LRMHDSALGSAECAVLELATFQVGGHIFDEWMVVRISASGKLKAQCTRIGKRRINRVNAVGLPVILLPRPATRPTACTKYRRRSFVCTARRNSSMRSATRIQEQWWTPDSVRHRNCLQVRRSTLTVCVCSSAPKLVPHNQKNSMIRSMISFGRVSKDLVIVVEGSNNAR
jgi:hypothetical protein